jgi:hypothetical protein
MLESLKLMAVYLNVAEKEESIIGKDRENR